MPQANGNNTTTQSPDTKPDDPPPDDDTVKSGAYSLRQMDGEQQPTDSNDA
jgi:hypothetical protein